MSRLIGHVKKEIRLLGLDTCNPRLVVGVVVRGGSFLDGVETYPRARVRTVGELAKSILGSKYFPELRAIMIHDPENHIDSSSLRRTTGLPVIEVSVIKRVNARGYRAYRKERHEIWTRADTKASTLRRILHLSCMMGRLPEPTRIAHLLATRAGLPRVSQGKE